MARSGLKLPIVAHAVQYRRVTSGDAGSLQQLRLPPLDVARIQSPGRREVRVRRGAQKKLGQRSLEVTLLDSMPHMPSAPK